MTGRPVFCYRPRLLGVHWHVSVFAGPDPERLALAGELCFREDEWQAFREEVRLLCHTIREEEAVSA